MNAAVFINHGTGKHDVITLTANDVMKTFFTAGHVDGLEGEAVVPGTDQVDRIGRDTDNGNRTGRTHFPVNPGWLQLALTGVPAKILHPLRLIAGIAAEQTDQNALRSCRRVPGNIPWLVVDDQCIVAGDDNGLF